MEDGLTCGIVAFLRRLFPALSSWFLSRLLASFDSRFRLCRHTIGMDTLKRTRLKYLNSYMYKAWHVCMDTLRHTKIVFSIAVGMAMSALQSVGPHSNHWILCWHSWFPGDDSYWLGWKSEFSSRQHEVHIVVFREISQQLLVGVLLNLGQNSHPFTFLFTPSSSQHADLIGIGISCSLSFDLISKCQHANTLNYDAEHSKQYNNLTSACTHCHLIMLASQCI